MKTGNQIVQDLPWKWGVQGKIFIIGGLGYMFDAWDVALNGFLTPLLAKHFELSVGEKGLIATANLIGMAVGAVAWGTIADRMGRKKAFSLTLLIFALFSILGALSPSYEVFLLFRFLAGVGLGGCIPVDYALVGEFSPSRLRGKILAAMDIWWPVGATLCGVAATLLEPVQGNWRWMLAVMIMPALLLFWVRRGIPESPLYLAKAGREAEAREIIDDLVLRTGAPAEPYVIAAPPEETGGKRGLRAASDQLRLVWSFSPRITSVAWSLFVTVMTVYYVALSWMPTILKDEGHTDAAAFAKTTLMTGVGIVGVVVSASLVEVVGRKWVIGASAPVSAAALVAFAASLDLKTAALVWLGIFGFLIQVAIPVLYAYVSELYPTHIRASGFGWASSASRVVSGFIPFIFGTLLWPTLGLTWTFAVLGGVTAAVVLWMAAGAPETRGRELDHVTEPERGPGSEREPGSDPTVPVRA
ncbi:MFS transporter [Spirillospora sp. NPDC048911]|uniref:MFS transporter n=1 Tax=Spirillospora sp. NPDC048911 TaxID=3364527 RepID=UPI00371ED060